MPPNNRIITRGMGPSRGVPGRTGLVVQGFGGILAAVVETGKRVIRAGQSGAKRALRTVEEIIVSARLLRVNDEQPSASVSGYVRVKLDSTRAHAVKFLGRVSSKTKDVFDGIKVTVNRIK